MTEDEIRRALIDASLFCIERGLSNATAGNISIRQGDAMIITPSGIPPEDMRAEMMVACTFDGGWDGKWKPSSEWALHAAIYTARADINAVVHAHPTHCVALSCQRRAIPAFHYMIAGFGGEEVPCAPYETFGSKELAQAVAGTLGDTYHACLMANHGMIALGADLPAAVLRSEKLEALAQQYMISCAYAPPVLLTAAEMARVRDAYKGYGYEAPQDRKQ